jgi:hypothetical protein
MSESVPTLPEFKRTCREEFAFLVESFGFHEAVGPPSSERFSVRFEKGDLGLEIRGEGYGTTASCRLNRAEKGPLDLIYLVPPGDRPQRTARRDRMGQLDHVRELAQQAQVHARDFLSGDGSRFEAAWAERSRSSKPGSAAG